MPALGRYELIRPLARGGMADVFLARRRVAGVEKRLVIKRLRRDHSRDPRFLDLFVREAQLSMSLVQQNVVPVFDFGRIGDDVFLAMEYIPGKDLGSSLARARDAGHRMPALLAAWIAAECCQALDHAHRRREPVIHRDVTPRNVLLSWDGEVKLADFGIAAVVGDARDNRFGTPGYMAPEQARGERPDPRVDVYALGLVLWEAATGEHVRPATDPAAALAAARSGSLPPIPPELPLAFAAIIERATQRAPEARFATARALAEALDVFIIAERARIGRGTPSQQLADWLRVVWGDDHEPPIGELVADGGELVTFLDDGIDDIRGARTARSLAMTADDAPPPAPPPVAPDGGEPSRRRRWIGLAVAAGTLVAGATLVVLASGHRATTSVPTDAATRVADPDPPADASARVADPIAPADAPASDLIDARTVADGTPARRDAASRSISDAAIRAVAVRDASSQPPAKRVAFTIGAIPWANITVDGDPTSYETPATLQMVVGAHRVTFANPELGVSRTVTIIVTEDGPARHVEKMR